MKIGSRDIGRKHRPYLIAEMSGNHNQSLDRALQIVDAAAASGADAVKLQTYTADTMTLDLRTPGFVIDDPKSLWNGRNLYDLYDEAHTPWDWHAPIMERARSHGIDCFSSPFDSTAVDFLEALDVSAYKIASFELLDIPLIERVAATGKPMIMSTGMASVAEIGEAVTAARRAGAQDIILLKCTSTYPAEPVNTNLATIPTMRETFGCEVGLSDHTMGTGVAVASIALGAPLIEKHFTLARADGGPDAEFSLEPAEFAALVRDCKDGWRALGKPGFERGGTERANAQFRRSLYVVADVAVGEALTTANVRSIRPGLGLAPKHLPEVLGRRAARPLAKGEPMAWDMLT